MYITCAPNLVEEIKQLNIVDHFLHWTMLAKGCLTSSISNHVHDGDY